MRTIRTTWMSLLALCTFILFQNFSGCDHSIQFASANSQQRSQGGGGEPTDGKPHSYYRWIRDYRCKGKPTIVGEVFRQGSKISAKTLNLDTCQLTPQPIDSNQISLSNLDPQVLGFNGGIYVERPLPPPNLASLGDPYELWCRSEELNKIELLIKPRPGLGEHAVEILVLNSARIGPIQLERQLRADTATYLADGIKLTANRSSSTTLNEVVGELSVKGVAENTKMRCRFGSDLDGHNHFAPAHQMDFFGPTLPTGVALTRASTATFINQNGFVQTAGINTPRFDYDVASGLSKGLLVERSSTNLLTRSSEFDQWTQLFTVLTVNTTETLDPSGGQAAELVRTDTTLEVHQRLTTVDLLPNEFYTYSVFIKPANVNPVRYVRLQILDTGDFVGTIWVNFDILNPSVAVNFGETDARHVVAGVERVGNGWLRLSISGIPPSTSTGAPSPHQIIIETVPGFPSDGVYADPLQSGYYVWGAQLEQSESLSSYIPTTTAPVTRAADILNASGLGWWNSLSNEMSLMIEKQLPFTTASPRDSSFGPDNLLDLSSLGSNLLNVSFDRTSAQVTTTRASSQSSTVAVPNLLVAPNAPVILRPIATYVDTGVLTVTSNGFNTEAVGGAGSFGQPDLIRLHSNAMGPASTHLQMLRYWPFKLNDVDRIDLSIGQQPQ